MYQTISKETLEELCQDFPSRLVVMLYDEAIASLEAAIEAVGRGDIEARFNATAHTAEVISQLYLALDMEQGGVIAENLSAIYNFVLGQLPELNFRNDPAVAEQAIMLLRPIRDSWFELDERIRAGVADSEAGGAPLSAPLDAPVAGAVAAA
jgi:flagellar protein FliS